LGAGGRRFKSGRPDHDLRDILFHPATHNYLAVTSSRVRTTPAWNRGRAMDGQAIFPYCDDVPRGGDLPGRVAAYQEEVRPPAGSDAASVVQMEDPRRHGRRRGEGLRRGKAGFHQELELAVHAGAVPASRCRRIRDTSPAARSRSPSKTLAPRITTAGKGVAAVATRNGFPAGSWAPSSESPTTDPAPKIRAEIRAPE